MWIGLVTLSNHSILCHTLLLLPSILPSVRVFSSELTLCIRWPNNWSFNFSMSPSSEYSGLISFRIGWFDLLAVWGTLKGLLEQHSSKAWILQHSAFFMVQHSHPYMTTVKTIALTRWTFISKVMFLLFKILSRFIIAFLPNSKCLLISWVQSLSAVTFFFKLYNIVLVLPNIKVILKPKKIIYVTAATFSPSICHEVMASQDAMT